MLLVFFVFFPFAFADLLVTQTYQGSHALIAIPIAHSVYTFRARVESVDWCASPSAQVDLKECNVAGLQHLRLLPRSGSPPLVKQVSDEPNILYIDPKDIGGWDPTRNAAIVVRAVVDLGGTQVTQVVNFLKKKEEITTTTAVQTEAITVEETTSSAASVAAATETSFVTEISTTPAPPARKWLPAILIFSIGMCIVFGLAGLLIFKRSRQGGQERRLPEYDGIEMVDMHGSDFLTDDERLERMGVNEAFKQNNEA